MTDRPVIGQLGRTESARTRKVELIGALKPEEWAAFIECLKECAARFGNKITVIEKTYHVKIPILKKLDNKKKKKKA